MRRRRRMAWLLGPVLLIGICIFCLVFSQTRLLKRFGASLVPASVSNYVEDVLLSSSIRGPPVGPPLYTHTRMDRAGMIITEMLNAYAYCVQTNRIYGGSCPPPNQPTPQFEGEAKKILQKIGLSADEDDGPEKLSTLSPPLRFVAECPKNESQGIMLEREKYHSLIMRKIWTPAFVRHMHSLVRVNSSQLPYSDAPRPPYVVAVHVRRGDVHPCHHTGRYLPDSHYIKLLDMHLPVEYRNKSLHRVYVFSESLSYENWTLFTESDYNVQLVLDSELDIVWQTMITADLVLLSRSTFSMAPAMLNCFGTVVYTRFPRASLLSWETAPEKLVEESEAEVRQMAAEVCNMPEKNPWFHAGR